MHCTSCGTEVPSVVALAPFCAFCGARRTEIPEGAAAFAKAVAQAQSGGGGISVVLRSRSSESGARVFTAGSYDLCMAFDGQAGFALVGAYAPPGEPPRLRGYDVVNKRVAWEALSGQKEIADVDDERLAVRGRNVYVSLGRAMRVLDLFTGQAKWGSEFSDKLAYDSAWTAHRGIRLFDSAPAGQRGAVLTMTADYTLTSFDRDTGQPLWREVRESLPSQATPVADSGLVFFRSPNELVNPLSQTPVAKWDGRIERCDIEGQYGIWQVEHWGWRDREGILLHDFATNKEVFFQAVENIEDDVPSVMGHQRVFCALESGAKLFAAPHGKPVELMPSFHIRSLLMCGPTLFVLLEKTHGTDYRRVLGVDPATLAVRWDLGELTTEPDDDWTRQMCTNGRITVLVTSPTNDDDDCELWAVDPAGNVRWKTKVGDWNGHYFLGGHVVVHSDRGWQILRPDDGQAIAAFHRE